LSHLAIDGKLLRKMIIGGANALEENKAIIDALNVFPVPDGDTGTNMSLTVIAAARQAAELDTNRACEVARAAASGSLRGARGNSGVIVSQLFRGFAKSVEGLDTISASDIADAFTKAVETAYKAVMKPKEGTILTVAKVIADKANDMVIITNDFDDIATGVMDAGYDMLKKTTNMLPQLKEAGVVDAGGKGLLIFLDGAITAKAQGEVGLREATPVKNAAEGGGAADFSQLNTDDIVFAYCTEFFINIENTTNLDDSEGRLKAYLESVGDSIVVAGDDNIIKVHIHTNHPGGVLEEAMKYGFLSNLKIENMKLQHTSLIGEITPVAPKKDVGIIAVAMGGGMVNLFKELGADTVITGGQTMNPAAADFLEAIDKINADNIIILPNNKNVILAAAQAAKMADKSKTVFTVPSKSMPEGLSAMLSYVSGVPAEKMSDNMNAAITQVITGEVTFAVRNTTIGGRKIKKGDYLFMAQGKIETVGTNLDGGALELLNKMTRDIDAQIVTIYYGESVTEADAVKLKDRFLEQNPDVEVDLQNGEQPLYYYIFSAE